MGVGMSGVWDATPVPVEHYEPRRDRFGRYLLPHPDTHKDQSWTRATTWAKTVADLHGLNKWGMRMVAVGLVSRPDLFAQAASLPTDDKRALDRVCDAAKEAAAASAGANLGTALHTFTERMDRGEVVPVPAPWDRDVVAYMSAMNAAGAAIDPNHIERITVVPALGVAGTLDRIVRMPDGRYLIADLKTGRDLSYSWGDIAIQLALYAHGSGLYVPPRGGTPDGWEDMPPVDRTEALVMHLPAGTGECTLYMVDIAEGWRMAEVCGTVREWRKAKGLATKYVAPSNVVAFPVRETGLPTELHADPERQAWIVGRLTALATDDLARAVVADRWPATVAKTPDVWTDADVTALDAMLTEAESRAGAPFPASDPAAPPATHPTHHKATGTPVRDDLPAPVFVDTRRPEWCATDNEVMAEPREVAEAMGLLAACDAAGTELAKRWAREATDAERPFDRRTGEAFTVRHCSIAAASFVCADAFGDPAEPDALTRAALAIVLGKKWGPRKSKDWTVGATLGSLSTLEAAQLHGLATRFADGDRATAVELMAKL